MPRSILSDRDPLFMSNFWQEIFKLQKTVLKMSFSYHPETDGQTEVVNRCLETYLRCFATEQPRSWSKWLAWQNCGTTLHFMSLQAPLYLKQCMVENPLQ